MSDWRQQRQDRQRRDADRTYRKASHKAQQNWDEPTKSRMNFIMGCVVLPLIVVGIGGMFLAAYLTGQW